MGDHPESARQLSFERLAAGALVHKSLLGDVLVTDAITSDTVPDAFVVGVQWPYNHRLLGRGRGLDSALIAETVRQASAYVAHTYYGVSLDQQFLLTRLTIAAVALESPPPPGLLLVEVAFAPVFRADASLASFRSEAVLRNGTVIVATGAAQARLVPKATYSRSRQVARMAAGALAAGDDEASAFDGRRGDRIPAAAVGVLDDELVTVARPARPGLYEIIVDPASPAFFDHELDHVPGMLLLEAVRQAARHHAGRAAAEPDRLDLEFTRLIEFGLTTTVEFVAPQGTADAGELVVVQNGVVATRGTVRLNA